MQIDKDFENFLLRGIAELRLPFDVSIGLGRVKRNIRIRDVDVDRRQLVLSDRTVVKFPDIKALRFKKGMAKRFLSLLPESFRKARFKVFLYPHSRSAVEWFYWHGPLVHYLILSEQESIVMYAKLYVTAFSFVRPYPEHLISGDVQSVPVLPGKWREDFREIRSLLLKSLKSPVPCTFVMRDGREFTGIPSIKDFRKNSYILRLFLPDRGSLSHKVFLLAHAIEDFWET